MYVSNVAAQEPPKSGGSVDVGGVWSIAQVTVQDKEPTKTENLKDLMKDGKGRKCLMSGGKGPEIQDMVPDPPAQLPQFVRPPRCAVWHRPARDEPSVTPSFVGMHEIVHDCMESMVPGGGAPELPSDEVGESVRGPSGGR